MPKLGIAVRSRKKLLPNTIFTSIKHLTFIEGELSYEKTFYRLHNTFNFFIRFCL